MKCTNTEMTERVISYAYEEEFEDEEVETHILECDYCREKYIHTLEEIEEFEPYENLIREHISKEQFEALGKEQPQPHPLLNRKTTLGGKTAEDALQEFLEEEIRKGKETPPAPEEKEEEPIIPETPIIPPPQPIQQPQAQIFTLGDIETHIKWFRISIPLPTKIKLKETETLEKPRLHRRILQFLTSLYSAIKGAGAKKNRK